MIPVAPFITVLNILALVTAKIEIETEIKKIREVRRRVSKASTIDSVKPS